MTVSDLLEQIQENLIGYLEDVVACEHHDTNLDPEVIDTVCQIVIDTFDGAVFAPAPRTGD